MRSTKTTEERQTQAKFELGNVSCFMPPKRPINFLTKKQSMLIYIIQLNYVNFLHNLNEPIKLCPPKPIKFLTKKPRMLIYAIQLNFLQKTKHVNLHNYNLNIHSHIYVS